MLHIMWYNLREDLINVNGTLPPVRASGHHASVPCGLATGFCSMFIALLFCLQQRPSPNKPGWKSWEAINFDASKTSAQACCRPRKAGSVQLFITKMKSMVVRFSSTDSIRFHHHWPHFEMGIVPLLYLFLMEQFLGLQQLLVVPVTELQDLVRTRAQAESSSCSFIKQTVSPKWTVRWSCKTCK